MKRLINITIIFMGIFIFLSVIVYYLRPLTSQPQIITDTLLTNEIKTTSTSIESSSEVLNNALEESSTEAETDINSPLNPTVLNDSTPAPVEPSSTIIESSTAVIESSAAPVIETTQAKETSAVNQETTEEIKETIPDEEIKMNVIDHTALEAQNQDYMGWLYIPTLEISYPVVMSHNNNDYLKKSFTGEKSSAGTLYIDAYSKYGNGQSNLLIYGHNMKNGSMFGLLKKFRNKNTFEKIPKIVYETKDGKKCEFMIYAVSEVGADLNAFIFKLDGFGNKEYYQTVLYGSELNRPIEIEDESGHFISLVTCVGDSSRRLVVSGYCRN